jgi:hypothetical protein
MWNAVQKGWAHPQHYAVCVRDHPKTVFEEMERLLLAVRYYLQVNQPAKHNAARA